jgi:hypothetical protein
MTGSLTLLPLNWGSTVYDDKNHIYAVYNGKKQEPLFVERLMCPEYQRQISTCECVVNFGKMKH